MADDKKFITRDYRGVDGAVDDAVDNSDKVIKSLPVSPKLRSNAVTAAQALSTERKAEKDEGSRAFGAPMTAPADIEKRKAAQSTDSNND